MNLFPTHIFSLKAMLRLASILVCCIHAHGWAEPVIPAMCLPYAEQLQAVIKSPSVSTVDVLDEGFISGRSYRFDRIVSSLDQQWQALNQSFVFTSAPLSGNQRYLRECLNDPTQCHGYILKNIDRFIPLYCGHKILNQAFTDAQKDIPQRVEQCTTLKDQFFEAPHMENPRFVHACLDKNTMKYKNFEAEYDYLNQWNQTYQKNLLASASKAPDQEIFFYMYQKIIHELDQHAQMTETIAQTLDREKFQQQIRSCPLDNKSTRLNRSYGFSQQVFSKNYTLRPKEVNNPAYIKELNIRFLEEKFANRAPEDFSEGELLEWVIFRMPSLIVTQEDAAQRMELLQEFKNNHYFYSDFALYEKAYLPDFHMEQLKTRVDKMPSDTFAHLTQLPRGLQEMEDQHRAAKRNLDNQPDQDVFIEQLRQDTQLFKQVQQDSKIQYQQANSKSRPTLSRSPTLTYKKFYHATYPKVAINIGMAYFLQHLFEKTLHGEDTEFSSFENFMQQYNQVVCGLHQILCESTWYESYDKDFQKHYQRLSAVTFNSQQMDKELADIEKKIFVANDYCYQNGKNAKELAEMTDEEKQIVQTKLETLTQPVFEHSYFQSVMASEDALIWLGLEGKDPVDKCLGAGVLFGHMVFTKEIRDFYYQKANRVAAISYSEYPPYRDYRPRDASVQPQFKIKRQKIIELSASIGSVLSDKLEELGDSFELYQIAGRQQRMPESRVEELKEAFHGLLEHYPLPVLEYFQEKQTFENGYFLCEMFINMRDAIEDDQAQMEMYDNVIMGLSLLAIPATMGVSSWLALSARTMVAVNSYVFGGLSLAYGGLNIHELVDLYELKNNATVSFATGHMQAIEASEFYKELQSQIDSTWLEASIGSILFFSIEGRFMFQGGKRFVRQTFDKEFRGVQKRRMAELEDIRKAQDPEQNGHIFDRPKVFNHITSLDEVSRSDYRQFIDILHTQANQRTRSISKMAEIERIRKEQEILAKNFLREKSPALQKSSMLGSMEKLPPDIVKPIKSKSGSGFSKGVEDFKELARPIWYRFFENKKTVMKAINQRVNIITSGKISESQRFKLEEKFVRYLQKIKALNTKVGTEFLSKDEYNNLVKKMKYFLDDRGKIKPFVTVDGKRVAFSTREKYLRKAMMKMIRIKPSLAGEVDEVLRTLIRSHMFDGFDWVYLLRNFSGKIENVVDCRAFERAIEFAVYEETSIWKQLNRSFFTKNKEMLSSTYYKRRKELIIENFDEVYAVAQYGKYREYQLNTQIARRLQSDYEFSLEQIQKLYRKRYLDSFDLNFAIANRTTINKRVQKLESNPLIGELFEPVAIQSVKPGSLPDKRVFLQRFYKNLEKETIALQKGFDQDIAKMSRPTFQDIRHTFKKSYHQSKVKSMVYRECANPASAIRNLSNVSMNRFMVVTGAWTELGAYTTVHWDEDKTTAEFWTRGLFDIMTKAIGNYVRSQVFTSNASPTTPVVKIGKEMLFMAGLTAVIDAPLYAQAEKRLWGHGDQLLANDQDWTQFLSDISQSPELAKQPLKPYNQLIANDHKFYQRYKAIYDETMADMDNILAANPDIQDENQLYDYLANQQLIEKLESDKDTQEELLDWYAQFLADQHNPEEPSEDEGWLNQALEHHPMMTGGKELYESQNFSFLPNDLDNESYEGVNRWLFYRAWDATSGAHISYVKNFMIYSLLCKARIHPSWNMHLAKATYVAVTSAETYAKLLLREKTTGK